MSRQTRSLGTLLSDICDARHVPRDQVPDWCRKIIEREITDILIKSTSTWRCQRCWASVEPMWRQHIVYVVMGVTTMPLRVCEMTDDSRNVCMKDFIKSPDCGLLIVGMLLHNALSSSKSMNVFIHSISRWICLIFALFKTVQIIGVRNVVLTFDAFKNNRV